MEALIKAISEWLHKNSDAISPSMFSDRVRAMLVRPLSTLQFHQRDLGADCTVFYLGGSCFVVKVDSNPTGIDHKLTESLEETVALALKPAATTPRKSENQIKPGHVQVIMSAEAMDRPELRAVELYEIHADEGVFRVADGIDLPRLSQYGEVLVPRKMFWKLFVTAAPEMHGLISANRPTFPSTLVDEARTYNAPRDNFVNSAIGLLIPAVLGDERAITYLRANYCR